MFVRKEIPTFEARLSVICASMQPINVILSFEINLIVFIDYAFILIVNVDFVEKNMPEFCQ